MFAVTVYGRKPFAQNKPSAILNEIWDILVREAKSKSTDSQAACCKALSCTVLAGPLTGGTTAASVTNMKSSPRHYRLSES